MLSFGIDASLAFWIAVASAALPSGSPPPSRAATVIARASLVKCWPRRASTTAFLCLICAHLEWPATGESVVSPTGRHAPCWSTEDRRTGLHRRRLGTPARDPALERNRHQPSAPAWRRYHSA